MTMQGQGKVARMRGSKGHDRRESEGKCMTDHGYRISSGVDESMGNGMRSRCPSHQSSDADTDTHFRVPSGRKKLTV